MSRPQNKPDYKAAIREIGRGKHGARSLDRVSAKKLWGAVLANEIDDLELGAILMALRIKSESIDELAGFLDACQESLATIEPPSEHGIVKPVVLIPSYNGARAMPNLTPLLALGLANLGIATLVHGIRSDANRTTTYDIFEALGISAAASAAEIATHLTARNLAFAPISTLSPGLDRILMLRQRLGVRNSAHTLVKMLQPINGPALRLVSYTHPEYLQTHSAFFAREPGDVLLMRATEGEAVANTRRGARIDWFHNGQATCLRQTETVSLTPLWAPPPCRDALKTAQWIQSVLAGERPMPPAIDDQIRWICKVLEPIHHPRLASPGGRVAQEALLIDAERHHAD